MANDRRKILVFALIFLALFSVAFTSGCVQQSAIKSEQQVGEAVTNISQNVEDVSSILTDIDRKLG